MLRVFNFFVLIMLVLFAFAIFRGCKTATFYDIDKTQLDADNANKICSDSNVNCRADFGLYAEKNKILGYSGIWADLIFERDSATNIENIVVEISPSQNQQPVYPVSFECIGGGGTSFYVIKDAFNDHRAQSVRVYFQGNIDKYDSLYLKIHISYSLRGLNRELTATHIYKKGNKYSELSR